jgi:sulfide:quinone oxidoreductase
VSSEPFLGHFGIGGLPHGEALLSMFLKKEHITPVMNGAMDHVDQGRLVLADGKSIDFQYAMIVPPFLGQQVISSSTEIADAKGYVQVRDTYQTLTREEVYAVGIAVAVDVPWQTPTPVGVPRPDSPPSAWRTSPRVTSRRRSGASSPPQERRSVTSLRSA